MRKVEGETLEIVSIRQARWCERECETVVGKVCESVLVAPSEKVLVVAQMVGHGGGQRPHRSNNTVTHF